MGGDDNRSKLWCLKRNEDAKKRALLVLATLSALSACTTVEKFLFENLFPHIFLVFYVYCLLMHHL